MALLTEKKNSDLVSEPSMHFWGIMCLSGKHYAQVVGQRFRITMAVLDPKSDPKDKTDKIVSLIVKRGEFEYLLCVLKHGEIHQVNLNLIFDKGENVVFYVRGHGNVCLSGYQLTESEIDVLNDEIGYLCPLVEVKSEKKVPKSEPESEAVAPKSKKKAKREKDLVTSEDRKMLKSWNSMSHRSKNGEVKVLEFDDESDESDEDFSIGEESSDSLESEEELDEEELEEELEEEIMKLKADGEEAEEDEEVVEMEPESQSVSRKRKHEKKSKLQENSLNDKDSSDSDVEDLSTADTPSPKKAMKVENSSEKKMSKKKKKLNESNSTEKSVKEGKPKSTENADTTPSKNPVQKLEGGIEVQDVIVGKGPVATKGKMVHVFYVGRFQNKEIFDSRLPGKKPFSFKLGAQQVIKGWDIGLQGMKVGGKRKLKIPPSMGYGSSRIEGIPPNSTLFFLVELQAVS